MSQRNLSTLYLPRESTANDIHVAAVKACLCCCRNTSARTRTCFRNRFRNPNVTLASLFFCLIRACLRKLVVDEASAHASIQSFSWGTRPFNNAIALASLCWSSLTPTSGSAKDVSGAPLDVAVPTDWPAEWGGREPERHSSSVELVSLVI